MINDFNNCSLSVDTFYILLVMKIYSLSKVDNYRRKNIVYLTMENANQYPKYNG